METIFQADRRGHGEGRPSVQGRAVFRPDADPEGPRVIEYNARFWRPETQAVLSRLDTDLFDIFNAVIDEKLENIDIRVGGQRRLLRLHGVRRLSESL